MKKQIVALLTVAGLVFTGCDAILDRPLLTKPTEENFGKSEQDYRLYVNQAYPLYFVGYGENWGTAYTPLKGYSFSDDNASTGKQSSFENSVPSSRGTTSTSTGNCWISQYASQTWNFAWVRKWNVMLEMLEKNKSLLDREVYEHWNGVARFFRGYEYSRLVTTFGDVPYYDRVLQNTDTEEMYKDRTLRNEVMGHVYDDFEVALSQIRKDDGEQYLNRYIAAGFISRLMLFEGTWQKYHYNNMELAKIYLEQAMRAADLVLNSNKWQISSDFKSLFGSADLKGNKEVLMYRHYDAAVAVTHSIASYSNLTEGQGGATLALAKQFICNDGKTYQHSTLANAADLNISDMIKTRDPRFEATFWDAPRTKAQTLLYSVKFIDREGPTYAGGTYPPQYSGKTNTNDYPVMRLAEVMLNWLEAKAELATMGGDPVIQADIDRTINQIRNRPLDEVAIEKGIQKTAPMQLAEITADFDPDRDKGTAVAGDYEVSPLLWEIRRERRMEFVYEHSRLLDLKRWKKLHYMNNEKYPDTMLGLWINIKEELPQKLTEDTEGVLTVAVPDGHGGYSKIVYDGTNADEMVGYYVPDGAKPRDPFSDRSYLSPIGENVINEYADLGFSITQTTGW